MTGIRNAFAVGVSVLALTAACSGADDKRQQHFDAANSHFDAGAFAEAVIEYRSAIKQDPNFGEARYKLAEAYARLGSVAEAGAEYVRAADLLPHDEELQLKAGRVLLVTGQFEDAKTRAERVIAKNPKNAEAQVLLGNALAGLNDLEGAVREIETAIGLSPARGQSHTNLAVLRLAEGKREEARAAFEKAVQVEPTSLPAHLALANFYLSNGDSEGAERALTRALAIAPKDTVVTRALAAFYMATGRASEAEAPLKKNVEVAGSPESRLALADYYSRVGRMSDAAAVLDQLKGTPLENVATVRLAHAAYGGNQQQVAHRMVEEVLTRQPQLVDALVAKSQWYLSERRLDEALNSARAATEAAQSSIQAHYWLGVIHGQRGEYDAAQVAFQRVLELNPRATAAQLALSELHLARGNAEAALQFASDATRNQPNNPDSRVTQVRAMLQAGRLDEAERAIAALKESNAAPATLHTLTGSLVLAKGNPSAARAAFDTALQLAPRMTEATIGLIATDIAEGKTAESHVRVNRALASKPNDPYLLMLAARIAASRRQFVEAEQTLQRLLQVQPANLGAYALLGEVYAAQMKLDDARREFETVIQRQPKSVAGHTMLGILAEAEGKSEDARLSYERALEIDERAAVAANNLAWMLAQSGRDLDTALRLAQIAHDRVPEESQFLDTLGYVYYRKQLPALAAPHFEQSIQRNPQEPVFHYHLGLAYEAMGEPQKAKTSYAQALKLSRGFDGSDDASQRLARLQ